MSGVLVGYVRGLTERPEVSAPLLEKIREQEGLTADDTWLYPKTVRPLTRGPLAGHALLLSESIQRYWERRGSPDRIILIGHSIGGLLVRYAYLQALGSLGGNPRSWARHLSRIVMLATPNRGWDGNRLGWWGRRLSWLAVPLTRGFAVRDVLRGSAFMTALRLEWLRRVGALGDDAPLVVQVRSGQDALVEPEDSRDVEVLSTGAQLVLPGANHADAPCVEGPGETYPGERWDVLKLAVLGEIASTAPEALSAEEQRFTSVVFVLHGIRAGNDGWVDQLRDQFDGDETVRVETGSYGRFSAYNFALPITRRRTLDWFLDQYSYVLARHPGLPFHFVGHSNGTYMLGQALKYVTPIKFDRVYLAGSVLPPAFDWLACADRKQVGRLVNVCAGKDTPVAWLCSGLRGFGMKDVGVGGFTGFLRLPAGSQQFRYLPGGHGEALVSSRLPGVASFVLTGRSVAPEGLVESPGGMFGLVSRAAPGLALALAAAWSGVSIWLVLISPLLLAGLAVFTVLVLLVLMVV